MALHFVIHGEFSGLWVMHWMQFTAIEQTQSIRSPRFEILLFCDLTHLAEWELIRPNNLLGIWIIALWNILNGVSLSVRKAKWYWSVDIDMTRKVSGKRFGCCPAFHFVGRKAVDLMHLTLSALGLRFRLLIGMEMTALQMWLKERQWTNLCERVLQAAIVVFQVQHRIFPSKQAPKTPKVLFSPEN